MQACGAGLLICKVVALRADCIQCHNLAYEQPCTTGVHWCKGCEQDLPAKAVQWLCLQ